MNLPSFFEDSMSQERDLVSDLRNPIATRSSGDDGVIGKVASPHEFNQAPWQPAFFSSYPRGLIRVLDYATTEGSQGNWITANINLVGENYLVYRGGENYIVYQCGDNLVYQGGERVRVRLIIGHRAIETSITELPDQTCGRWQLGGTIPHFSVHQTNTTRFNLAIQAVDSHTVLLDHVEFGEYTYWDSDYTSASASEIGIKRPREECRAVDAQNRPSTNTRSSRITQRHRIPSRLHRRSNLHPGRKYQNATENIEPMAVLNLITPLDTMCLSWDDAERQNGRRLVLFHKVQEGCVLNVTCKGIHPEEYGEGDAVVSCIRRDDGGGHCITSVDIINLLEKLVDEKFEVEEKNRIRRNIEGLKPTPLKKGQPALEDLYTRIMEYPDPKPRNIEKDIKVFDWNILPQALLKIISRYSLVSRNTIHYSEEPVPTRTQRSSSKDGSAGASDGEPAVENHNTELQLAYPPKESVTPRNLYPSTATVEGDYAADLQDVLLTPMAIVSESPVCAYGVSHDNIAPQLSPLFDYGDYMSNFIEDESSWRAALVKVEDVEEEPMEIRDRSHYGLQTCDSLEFQALREPNVLFSDSFCSI